MGLTGSQQAYKTARLGVARCGASRLAYLRNIWTRVVIAATSWTVVR